MAELFRFWWGNAILAECIRIFTTWQAIPFKRNFIIIVSCLFLLSFSLTFLIHTTVHFTRLADSYYIITFFRYFLATPLLTPHKRHMYSVTSDIKSPTFRHITCLTCNVSDECEVVDVNFSPTSENYVLSCLGPGVPSTHLMETPSILGK